MNTETTYLVTLQPTGNFYFGGERHFTFNGEANYLVKSNYYPQQTTVLGMLRYELLQRAGLLSQRNDDVTRLIGGSGFSPANTQGYGIIKYLSPVFLYNAINGSQYLTQPGNRQQGKLLQPQEVDGQMLRASLWTPMHTVAHYNVKKYLDEAVENSANGEVVALKDVFLTPTHTGNQKNNKDDETEALYKQTWCRFKTQLNNVPVKWCFGLYVTCCEAWALNDNSIVSMGGDQSAFVMRIRPVEKTPFIPETPVPAGEGLSQVSLLSHTCSTANLYALAHCAIAVAGDFRYIETTATTTQYYNVRYRSQEAQSTAMLRSGKQQLYKAGSVFWVSHENIEAFIGAINQPAFKTIGYNHYKITPATFA
jgi:CRISPR-associated protein Cmr3